jgi:hypothetical protein
MKILVSSLYKAIREDKGIVQVAKRRVKLGETGGKVLNASGRVIGTWRVK